MSILGLDVGFPPVVPNIISDTRRPAKHWLVLRSIQLSKLLCGIAGMIIAGRVGFLLQSFSKAKDLSFVDSVLHKKFNPIAGYKMQFGQSRQYFVSRTHAQGKLVLASLNNATQRLKESGLLKKLQYRSGVSPLVESWAVF